MKVCEAFLVGRLGPVAWVRIAGCANQHNSGGLKDFLKAQFEGGCRHFVIDLEECKGIDSTFIGLLYNYARKMDEESEPNNGVEIISSSERNAKSIQKLGLDILIHIQSDEEKWSKEQAMVRENIGRPLPEKEQTRQERAEMVLDAHEILMESNKANESRFRDVVNLIRQDMDSDCGNV